MWTQDLMYLLETMNKVAPDVLIDHIDNNGIIYTTNFKKISLRGFLDTRWDEKENFVRHAITEHLN